MPDSIGWMFENASSLGIVKNDSTVSTQFDGSIKTFLREGIKKSPDAMWPRNTTHQVDVNIL